MNLNSVQFDMLCLINRIMIRGRRTWVHHTRRKELQLLNEFFGRQIGLSWLDDNRGALKRNGFCRAWQHGYRSDDGTYDGSDSRRQFTLKACVALRSRGIIVYRDVWHAIKRGLTPPQPTDSPPMGDPTTTPQQTAKPTKNPFLDPEFRKARGLKPLPLWKTQES